MEDKEYISSAVNITILIILVRRKKKRKTVFAFENSKHPEKNLLITQLLKRYINHLYQSTYFPNNRCKIYIFLTKVTKNIFYKQTYKICT